MGEDRAGGEGRQGGHSRRVRGQPDPVWLGTDRSAPVTHEASAVPGRGGCSALWGLGVLHHLAQEAVDLGEPGPLAWVLLPAVKHQSVQGGGAVPGGWQPEAILHCLDHLGHGGEGQTGSFKSLQRMRTSRPEEDSGSGPRRTRSKWTAKRGLGLRGQGSLGRGQKVGA